MTCPVGQIAFNCIGLLNGDFIAICYEAAHVTQRKRVMWSYVKIALGLFVIVSCIAGGIAMLSGQMEESARRIVENGVDTTGVVEKRTKHMFAGRYGKVAGGGVYYTMNYSFTTLEGVKYGGEINITKDQAYSVNDGDKITVRYMKGQPTINAPLRFKEYMTEQDVAELPYGMMAFSFVLFIFGGMWLCWSGWQGVKPARRQVVPDIDPAMLAARRGNGPRQAFGQR